MNACPSAHLLTEATGWPGWAVPSYCTLMSTAQQATIVSKSWCCLRSGERPQSGQPWLVTGQVPQPSPSSLQLLLIQQPPPPQTGHRFSTLTSTGNSYFSSRHSRPQRSHGCCNNLYECPSTHLSSCCCPCLPCHFSWRCCSWWDRDCCCNPSNTPPVVAASVIPTHPAEESVVGPRTMTTSTPPVTEVCWSAHYVGSCERTMRYWVELDPALLCLRWTLCFCPL